MPTWAQTTYAPDSGKEKITISGTILDATTQKPPLNGLTYIVEKGSIRWWAFPDKENIAGENYVLVHPDGSYSITIDKGSELYFSSRLFRYKVQYSGPLEKSQTLNMTLEPNPNARKITDSEKKYLLGIDTYHKIWVSGTLTSPDGKPTYMATVALLGINLDSGAGPAPYVISDKNGKFKVEMYKGFNLRVASSRFENLDFIIHSDTLLNIKMKVKNPFASAKKN